MAVRRVNAQTRSLLAVAQFTGQFPLSPFPPTESTNDAIFDVLIPPIPQSGNAKIVFTSNRDGSRQIYSMNADGSNQTRLSNSTANDDRPRWSPNGSKIVFQSDRDNPDTGYMDIYVMNADGSGQTRLTTALYDDSVPSWSSDGSKIVFQSMRNGTNYQVYSMNADGSNQVNLTNTSASDCEPSWSPGGSQIAFASDRDHAGYHSVYVMNSYGTNQQRLTFSGSTVDDTQPAWSPNSGKIAFVSTRDSVLEQWQETDDFEIPEDDGQVLTKSRFQINKEVYVMNPDGSGQIRLTNNLASDDSPSWSPDGSKVVFHSDRERDCCDPTTQVWLMNADGSEQTDLSSNQFGDYRASWTSGNNQPPVANVHGPYYGMAGDPVLCNGTGSFDPDGSIVSYVWTFGDGGTSSSTSPIHTYAAGGNYNVVLTVTDNMGVQSSASTTATVFGSNQSPVANAGGPYSGKSGASVQFNASASNDPDGTIASYQWNFGDGAMGWGVAPTHTYSSVGTFAASVTVTDNGGATSTSAASTVISSPSNQPPVANVGGPYSALVGTAVQFSGSASYDPDGTITQYQWNFGDGSASGSSPLHTFGAAGSHLITLTVTDNGGATDSKSFNLTVMKAGGIHPESFSDDVSWDPNSRDSLDDPINKVGSAPNTTTGNNNFQIVAPVLSLPGRGIDLNLNLTYNSLVWNKSASEILFDIDHSFPAPGWQIGFGKLVAMGSAGALLIEPDGTRHGFTGKVSDYSYPNVPNSHVLTFKGQTTDGSLIEYRCEMSTFPQGVARYPNGTVVYYGNYSTDSTHPHNYAYPYVITDSNGNTIRIKYAEPWDEAEPRIERIIDSVGRVITFHYDSAKRLTSITGPGLPDSNGSPTIQTFVRIHYKTQVINLTGAFVGVAARAKSTTFSAIDAIFYPGTGKGYWFGGDSYSDYGMIRKVTEERGMSFSPGANLDEQGTVSEGSVTKQQIYDYPSTPAGLSAAPVFTHLTETWDGGPSSSPTTIFAQEENVAAGERVITITNPDGSKTIQKSFSLPNLPGTDPNKFKDGLMKEQQTLDSVGQLLTKTTLTWEKGTDDAPRLSRTEATDALGQVLTTNYDQYGANNSLGRTREYDYDGTTVIRTTKNSYLSYLDNDLDQGIDPTFGIRVIHPRRVNLIDAARVFAGDDSANKLAAQTVFKYDEYTESLKAYPNDCDGNLDLFFYGEFHHNNSAVGILSHAANFNPSPPSCSGGSGAQYITSRGNVTSVIRYADTSNSSSPGNPTTETRAYDMAGNVIAASRSCCEQTSSVFELATQYAFVMSETRGSADPNSLARVTTSMQYDLNTGVPRTQIDANGRPTTMTYYPGSLRPKDVVYSTGAVTSFEYDDLAAKVTQTSRLTANGTIANKTTTYLNGLGQVVREEALNANNTIDIVETLYDQFGRLWKQSQPYRTGDTPAWTETAYDAAGRVREVRQPAMRIATVPQDDSSRPVTKYFYNETARPAGASTDPGQTTKTVDPWDHWRWVRMDSSGQIAEVVEPNPDGGNGFVTKYTYSALGKLVRSEQGDQVRRFRYDSVGRLTQQKLAEASATLNGAGEKVIEPEMWSDVFTYDQRSNITSHTDARGVKTIFSYHDSTGHNDPLNRLQTVSFDTSRVETPLTVLPAPSLAYQYQTKPSPSSLSDVTQVKQVVATGVSTEDFDYDNEGRLRERRMTFFGRTLPMTITYGYDNLGRINQTTYPEQYQPNGSATRKVVTPSYDISSRVDGLKVNGVDYASQLTYNAASQITSLAIGTGVNQLNESYTYDPASSLLLEQTLQRSGTTLMNKHYDYIRYFCEMPGAMCQEFPGHYWYTGRLTRVSGSATYQHFTYDSLGRLKNADQGKWAIKGGSWQYRTDWNQSYSYDRYGNREGVVASSKNYSPVPQDGASILSYDPATNRINTAGYTYDAAGNQLTNGTGQSLAYDTAGRLAQVKDENGITVATYSYGASNQRLITQTGNESSTNKTYYIWNGNSVISEYTDPSGASMPHWSRNYMYLGGRLLATEEPNGTGGEIVHYHHPDRLSTRLITNNVDTSYFEQAHLPYGTPVDVETTTNSNVTTRRFTSYDRSETTGMDYAVNRTFDSRQNRFTQIDPIGMAATNLSDPQSLNMYSYVGNDPVNRVDPDGQFWGALFKLVAGLFRNLKPNIINGSFAYGNHPPVSVSFTTNFQDIGAGYGSFGVPIRSEGHWLPELLSPKGDPFTAALWAARGILSGDNDCSRFFQGAGLDAVNAIAYAVYSGGSNAYSALDVKIGIAMTIPTILSSSSAPILLPGMYAAVAPTSVVINSNGAFGRSASFDKLPRFGGYSPGTLQSRVLQLLHEAGHLVITDMLRTFMFVGSGKNKHLYPHPVFKLIHLLPLDGGKEDLSEDNTRRVLGACRKEIDALE